MAKRINDEIVSEEIKKVIANSVRFVTSTFSKTETLTISLIFAMNLMVLPYVLNHQQISRSLQLKRVPIELLAIFHTTKLLICLKQVT